MEEGEHVHARGPALTPRARPQAALMLAAQLGCSPKQVVGWFLAVFLLGCAAHPSPLRNLAG
jgi:hypothetical protein